MKIFTAMILSLILVSCASKKHKDSSATTATTKETTSATTTKAKAATNTSADEATCSLDKDERVFSVRNTGSIFELFYTKHGEEKSIANGSRNHCLKVSGRVQDKLTSAGFTCN